jgi:phthalate 4,5-dioxygenase oxygenase subunit
VKDFVQQWGHGSVRAVSLRLPPEERWADAGAPFIRPELGADFGYEL